MITSRSRQNVHKEGSVRVTYRLFFIAAFALLASVVFAQEQHPKYIHALYDLRAARWKIEHEPGDQIKTEDDKAAVIKINDAVNEIKAAGIDDPKGYDPKLDTEKFQEPGRLHHARDLLMRAREELKDADNEGRYQGLRDRVLKHIDEAIHDVNKAISG